MHIYLDKGWSEARVCPGDGESEAQGRVTIVVRWQVAKTSPGSVTDQKPSVRIGGHYHYKYIAIFDASLNFNKYLMDLLRVLEASDSHCHICNAQILKSSLFLVLEKEFDTWDIL